MDLLKHGESAYPADAWVEQQYMDDSNGSWSPSHKSGEFLQTQINFFHQLKKGGNRQEWESWITPKYEI